MSEFCQCPLAGDVEVPYEEPLVSNGVMFIGESPGNQEVKQGRVFIGRSGEILRSSAENAGISVKNCYIANSARCMINKKKLSGKQIKQVLDACRPNLVNLILKAKPKVLVLLGDFSLRQVLRTTGITRARGKIVQSKEFDIPCLPTFHPAFLLRYVEKMPYFNRDLSFLREFMDNDFSLAEQRSRGTYTEVSNILALLHKADDGETIRVALDTETHGLDYIDSGSVVISFSISFKEGTGYQVFLYERCPAEEALFTVEVPSTKKNEFCSVGVKQALNFDNKLSQLKRLCDHPNIRIITQNGNYDKHHIAALFRRNGVVPPKFSAFTMDIQVASHCLDENVFKQASLLTLSQLFLNDSSDWKSSMDGARIILSDRGKLTNYAGEDADRTFHIGKAIINDLSKDASLANYVFRAAMPITHKALYTIEEAGLYVDQKELAKVKTTLELRAEQLHTIALSYAPQAVINDHMDKGLKLTRRDLLKDILFSSKGFDEKPVYETKNHDISTDSEVRAYMLESEISDQCRQFLLAFNEWIDVSRLVSWSINQLGGFVREDGRVHSSLNITIAATGRVSSSRPNLMNIPKRVELAKIINKVITVPDSSWVFMEADASQAELRWIAHVSGDSEMIRVYNNDEDIHLNTAVALSAEKWHTMTEEQREDARTKAKPGNFGLVYGMSARGFVNYCHSAYGLKITEDEAIETIERWFATYPRITLFHEAAKTFCKEHGYSPSPLGRKRHLPEIRSDNYAIQSYAERQAINAPIQSASSDTVLLSLVQLLEDPAFSIDECLPVLFVHDSISFQVKVDKIDKYAKLIRHHMEKPPLKELFGITLKVPLKADVKYGKNRADMVNYNEV